MNSEATKKELMAWLSELEEVDLIQYLKLIKDASQGDGDWYGSLKEKEKEAIQMGINDVLDGRIISHEEVKKMYGT